MSISAVKSLRANPSPHAWTTLENLIKLAAAADIPLVGGAFGVASEIVDTFNVRLVLGWIDFRTDNDF